MRVQYHRDIGGYVCLAIHVHEQWMWLGCSFDRTGGAHRQRSGGEVGKGDAYLSEPVFDGLAFQHAFTGQLNSDAFDADF